MLGDGPFMRGNHLPNKLRQGRLGWEFSGDWEFSVHRFLEGRKFDRNSSSVFSR